MKKMTVIIGSAGVFGVISGYILQKRKYMKLIRSYRELADKHKDILVLLDQWLEKRQNNIVLVDYFKRYNYKNIAVYGMSFVGRRLVNELKDSDINIKYVVDKNANYIHTDLKVYRMEDDLPAVDAIIVTPITYFSTIKEELKGKLNCPIISAEDLIYEI